MQALSRAFRSRFLELHVGDIPDTELANILQERCALAPSYAVKLVAVMRELQRRRQVSRAGFPNFPRRPRYDPSGQVCQAMLNCLRPADGHASRLPWLSFVRADCRKLFKYPIVE